MVGGWRLHSLALTVVRFVRVVGKGCKYSADHSGLSDDTVRAKMFSVHRAK